MNWLWKTSGLTAGAAVLTTGVSLLGSVTHGDVVRFHGWVDPAMITAPQTGQYYVIADDGRIREPLCELEETDLKPGLYRERGRRYVNTLGRVAPVVVDVVGSVLFRVREGAGGDPTLDLEQVERHYASATVLRRLTTKVLATDLQKIAKDAESTDDYEDALRLHDCGNAVKANLASGLNVCQLNEVARTGEDEPLGVGFASLCLARVTDTEPRELPPVVQGSILFGLKQALIAVEPRG